MLPRATRVLIAFGGALAALTLTVATVRITSLSAVAQGNLVLSAPRRQLMGLAFAAFAGAVALGVLFLRRHRERGLEALDWLARLLCPLILLPLFAALTQRGFGTDLEEGALLGIFVLGFERLLRVSFAAWAERARWPADAARPWWRRALGAGRRAVDWYFARPRLVLGTVVLLSLAHALLISLWAVWQHQRFSTYGYDTGQYDQLFYTTLHGQWLAAPSQGQPQPWGDLAGSHADFIIFALLPIYALRPGSSTLLVMQAVLVATAAVPLYLFARSWLSTRWALVMAVAWLGYAPMHTGQLYGVHTQIFGAPFVMWAIFAVERRRWVLYWLFFALAISAREDVSMGMCALGVVLALSGHRLKTGVATAALSTLYFFVIRFMVMGSVGFANLYSGIAAFGEPGFGAIIQTLISNPVFALKSLLTVDKLRFCLQLLAPLAFLPVRRPALWLLLAPAAILTLFTTNYGPTISITFQYIFNWTPYAFAAAVVALALFGQSAEGLVRQRAAALTVLAATLLANLLWGAWAPNGSVTGGFGEVALAPPAAADLQREKDLQTLLAKVPQESSVCTADRIQPHTTQHLLNWSMKDGLFDCEYLLWSDLPGDLGADRGGPAMSSGKYVLVERLGGLTLAKKAPPPPAPLLPPPAAP